MSNKKAITDQLTKELLTQLYIREDLTARKIGERFSLSETAILNRLKRFNISKPKAYEKMVGKKFGYLLCLDEKGQVDIGYTKAVTLKFRCDCGNEVFIRPEAVRHGQIRCNEHCRMHLGEHSVMWEGEGEISGAMWGRMKRHAGYRSIEFRITIEYAWNLFLEQNRKCALSGIDLIMPRTYRNRSYRGYSDDAPLASLDRIDSSKGYIEGNVQWVYKIVNHMKWQLKEEDFIAMCRKIVETSG